VRGGKMVDVGKVGIDMMRFATVKSRRDGRYCSNGFQSVEYICSL